MQSYEDFEVRAVLFTELYAIDNTQKRKDVKIRSKAALKPVEDIKEPKNVSNGLVVSKKENRNTVSSQKVNSALLKKRKGLKNQKKNKKWLKRI